MGALEFNAGTHTYRLDGEVLPSVTQVLSEVGLAYYGGPPDSRAADRGTAAHEACRLADEDRLDEGSLTPHLAGYLQAWRAFRAAVPEAKFDRVEQPLYHPTYRFAGTPDRVGLVRDGRLVYPLVVDLKTGGPRPWHCLQTAAYALAAGVPIAKRWTVYLGATGKFRVATHEDPQDCNVFLAALTVWQWARNQGGIQK